MQNVGQSDNKKLDCNNKVSVTSTSMNNSSNSSSNSNNGKIMSTPLNKFSSNNSSPTKSDTETFSEFQPRVTDSSESDEESVSEILLACLYLRPDLLVDSFPLDQGEIEEIPDSCSDSCDNEVEENDDDEDDEDDEDEDDEDDIIPGSPDQSGHFLLADSPSDIDTDQVQTKARLEALLEAAANISPDKLPVIRRATLALDEAAQTLTKMRTDSSSREKNSVSRSLVAACNDNDVNAVRRLLGEGKSTINEATDDGDSLLSLACSAGYYELAQVLLAMSAQVEDRGQKNDCTPLMEAASAGHVDIIRLLINHGADVNAQSSTGNTPLMYACAGGHVAAVKELLAHDANVEDHNENGHTPLMEAASAGHVEVAKILLEHGAGINTHSNEFKESALTLACYKGHLDMVRFLLEAGADQEHKTDEMHTALMEASMDGHVEVARLLLDSGAQVNMPTDSFESPLTLAACGGHVDLAMLLIERGANIEEVNDEGYTPLMEAAREGHEEMVALLLSQGANINAQTEETQETALTLACCGGFIDVADYLIKNGAKIELGASTPLMEAAQEGHIDLVKYLLESGANVQAQTQTGDTALTYACENGHTDVAEMLLYYNAKLEHESEGGRTPLMKACRAGHICTVKFLIGKGADVNRQTTNNDHTPLSLACAGGHQSVVELLLKSGADPFHKLKDNSTMLIEAAKGGHIGVVQMLLDYPQSMGNNSNINSGMVQTPQLQQPFILPQQQQPPLKQQHIVTQTQQQQLLTVPPGLHEVPEAIRVSNQQLFHQPSTQQIKDGSDQQQQIMSNSQLVTTSTGNIIVDSNAIRQGTQQDSLLTHMRLLQMHQGFSDGLAHGLAHHGFIDGLSHGRLQPNVNQSGNNTIIIPPNNLNINQTAAATSSTPSTSTASSSSSTSNKQKSLLRHKIRQVPSSFESNLTTSEAQQVRSQPVGEDENPIYLTTNSGITEEQLQQHKKILQEYHQKLDYSMPKANIQLICETNGPPSTLLPSTAYVDITTPSGQGLVCGTSGISFATSNAPSLGQLPIGGAVQSAAIATFVTGAKATDSTFLLTANALPSTPLQQHPQTTAAATPQRGQLNKTQTTTTHISAPSEVSPNTAISDRPKVKPKNLKKSAGVLQQNQMPAASLSSTTTDQNLQIVQHSLANISLQPQPSNQIILHHATSPKPFHTGTQMISPPQINQNLNESNQQAQSVGILQPLVHNRATSSNSTTINNLQQIISSPNNNNSQNSINMVPIVNQQPQSTMLLTEQEEQQFSQLISNTQLNQKMLQMVATIPNHPFQKFAQRLCSDQPKSPSESPPLSVASELMPSSPSKNISVNNSELADLSRIFCEVMQDIKTELTTAQDFVQVHQHVNHQGIKSNVNPQFILPQPHAKLNTNQSQHNSMNETDDQLHMFTVEDHDSETISECGIYPPLDEPLNSFTTEDVGSVANAVADGSREPCNLEWVDYLDEVISALHGVPDLPVALQEIAANLTCHEFETYTNLIGINSFCKTRWTGQWQGNTAQPTQLTLADTTSSPSAATLEEQQRQQNNPVMTIDHQQLQQQLQQQLSVEQLQLLSHLQNQHNASLSIIPTSAIEQHLQTPNTFTLTSLPPHLTSQCQSTSMVSTSTIPMIDTQQQQHQQQQLQLQQQQNSLVDAQQQAKLVFNVETDKTSPPLQLLFQLPPAQQGQQAQQQPPSPPSQQQAALITNQTQGHQIPPTQIAQQTQTGVQMQPNIQLAPNLLHQNNITLHPVIAQQTQVQAQHCNQHQVATQTQQNPNGGTVITPAMVQMNQNQVVPITSKSVISSDRPSKKSTEKSRKDKNRYSSLRQAPAGQHQHGNTVPQFPVAGTSNVPQEKTIDVDSETDSNHDTALTLACAGGHEELVELLITRGANIEHRDKKGFTPLILAATAGHEKVVETLLKHGAELEAQSERTKDTPLSLACSGGRYEVVELLLNVGANKEHRNVSDYTPLSLAASGGYVNIIKLLLSSGAEINSRTGSKLGISPLMLAAMNGHTAAVKLLLDMGSDINAQIETNRNTALTLACFQGRHEVVSLLLDRKANVEHRAKTGLTPLMEAASGGYIEVGRVLLDKGADVNAAPVPSSRDTALTIAADKGHIKFVELLLSRGAAVEVKNKKGNSPLWLAANGGHLQVVEVLYNASADIDSQDNRKVSCLMAAFRKGHTKVVKWMVNHVTQFPSDQEMTRYINTVSDKELLEKCNECVKIIRAAKEAQAVKANKNASILLEELDMEKTREESRRAAAARRRERKKKKKIEKKEKRKMIELFKTNTNSKGSSNIDDKDEEDDDDDDDKDEDDDSDKDEEVTVKPNSVSTTNTVSIQHIHDREEGDSGIDANSHSSCSSADVKSNQIDKARNNKSKKKNNKINKQERISISPENNNNNISESSTIPKRKIELTENKKVSQTQNQKVNETNNNNNKNPKGSKDNNKFNQEKENIIPKDSGSGIQRNYSKFSDKKHDVSSLNISSTTNNKLNTTNNNDSIPTASHSNISTTINNSNMHSRKSLVFETSRHLKEEIYGPQPAPSTSTNNENIFINNNSQLKSNLKKGHHDHDGIHPKLNSKQAHNQSVNLNNNGKRDGEGWKEVVRKSSIQQSTTAPAEQGCKKVQVSAHAISRVIGRAGSNINAIRAATGAHIEVEKQGKAQGDRCITIKGSPEATRQASILIGTLIKDPDVDILTMVPRPNLSKPIVPTGTSIWEKSTPLPSVNTSISISTSSKAVNKSHSMLLPTNNPPKIITTTAPSSISAINTTKPTSSISSSTNHSGMRPQSQNLKSLFAASQSSRASHVTNQMNITANSIGGNSSKRNIALTTVSNTSKSTVSFTNSMHVLKNTIKNNSNTMNQIGTFHTSTTPSTFAAKLSSSNVDTNTKKSNFTGNPSPLSGVSNSIALSPIKHHICGSQSGLPAPFTSGISTNSTVQQTTAIIGSSTKPPFSQNSPQSDNSSNSNLVNNNGNTRSITPIGPPKSINRNVTASPLLLQSSPAQSTNCSVNSSTTAMTSSSISLATTSIKQQPVTGLASQLQSKINQLQHGNAQAHEYSLFNDSYSNQWEAKQYSSNNSKQFMENVPPLQVDASKAPGYRGTAVSSPVSTKTSSNGTTPPSQAHQTNSIVQSNVSNSMAGSSLSNTTINVPNSIHGEIGKPNNQQSQILQSQSGVVNTSGLAVQRPVMNASGNQIRQLDKYGMSANSAHTPNIRQNLFETTTNTAQNLAPQLINYGQQPEQMQQMFHPNIQTNPLHMSRLNPRASSFSSMHQQGGIQSQSKALGSNIPPAQQHPNQNYGGMFHQNGINNYQKMTTVPYNAAPGPARNQAQLGNNRWFSELGHLVNQREIMGIENGLTKNLGGSPAMSPNNSQGVISGIPNQPPPIQDDGRKPRPIGTERNWKLGYIGTNMEDSAPPSWMMEKQQPQQQIAPNWMPPPHPPIGPPRNHFIEDMQPPPPPPQIPQDHFPQWQMEYLNPSHLGPNQSNINLMQSLQYATFPAPIELGAPLPDKIEQWVEPEKQGWSAKWTF